MVKENDKHVLNYQYAIFPTLPQVKHLNFQMKECRLQWNRAVWTRKKLKQALQCGRVSYVLEKLMSQEKNNMQANRRKAIMSMGNKFPKVPFDQLVVLYDLSQILGNSYTIELKDLVRVFLVRDIEEIVRKELKDFRSYWKTSKDERLGKPPKRPVYYSLLRAISSYAGFESKGFMDRAFRRARNNPNSTVRFNVSGSGESVFTRACNPQLGQRANNNKGEPRFKRIVTGFGYQESGEVIQGNKIRLKSLPKGMEWVTINLHRQIPEDSQIKRVTVKVDVDTWYVTLSLVVKDRDYFIEQKTPNSDIGLDPGASTAITGAIVSRDTGEVSFVKFNWSPLEDSLEKLENISQKLSGKIGPDRRKKQKPSNHWLKLNKERSLLHKRIRNQRKNILHEISRFLVDHGFVAIGQWEPPREVKGRKEYKKGELDEVVSGHKGIKKSRRGGRDRSIASLRSLTEQKAKRSGAIVITHADEYNTTRRCSACGGLYGPKGDRSIREWTCEKCGVHHDRDENAALNILQLAWEQNKR